ncbi:hypothetical protein IV498_07155 [Paenarthrobacter sp. Z7-10]|uniref:hypothetical protein n=1 Tax=Paenarthrobacter sp. Z7-10 TaxID=2787635 RepID=UPI0022A93D3E|nr:hypothetical protein [Paenarthrobacter sp. Z7-10]MCZ2402968.1 hypothetical protein [Paenarthrobacter sp. Z7-10]
MMNIPKRHLAMLTAALILLSGCAASAADSASQRSPAPGAASLSPSASAPETSVSPSPSSDSPSASIKAAKSPAVGEPTDATKMVCGQETQDNVAKILALQDKPKPVSSWMNQLYTCTYALADGPLVLTVKESANPAAAKKYFDALLTKISSSSPIGGARQPGASGL